MNNFAINVRVYYEDTDAGGVVYHANYLNYYERCRTEYLRHVNLQQDEIVKKFSVVFVVKKVDIDYLKPAKFNDELTISLKVIKKSKASMVFEQQTVNTKQPSVVINKATVVVVCVDAKQFKTTAIPLEIHQLL